VVTRRDRSRDTKKGAVKIHGFGAAADRVHMSQVADFTVSPGAVSGPRAFAMAGVTPQDIDVAQMYDAFTITPLIALEDLGFCEKGEGGPFCASGAIAADGALPINTDGGGLSSNHPGKRGVFALIEAIRQLRGEGPGVQVRDCELSLAHGVGGFFSSSATMILGNG
jgi:acetyl-CoA acetyltransferase